MCYNAFMDKQTIFIKLDKLYKMWKTGELGGEFMPEDSNPNLGRDSLENYIYFTLPMALNYQRNSYLLWESAKATYEDQETNFVYDIDKVLCENFENVKRALTKHKVALQPNKQTDIWIKLCATFQYLYNSDIRKLFSQCNYDVNRIRNYIQDEHKKDFPYLSGNKICNYWLYVLYQYTDLKFVNREDLSVAPDTHVIKASNKLGVITDDEMSKSNIQTIVIERFNEILKGTIYCPIDVHTPLWLWSRGGFKALN